MSRRRKDRFVVTDCVSLAAVFLAANAHSVVPPLVKKSRSARLFTYKCVHNASLSLPTFCRFRRLGLSPVVPRWKTCEYAVRSGDGETRSGRENCMCKCRSFGRRKRINLTNKIFLPHAAPVRRRAFRCNQVFLSAVGARRHGLRIACGCVPRRERSLRRSSSPKKVTPRLCCSLVNALATRRLATNFFRFQADRFPPVWNVFFLILPKKRQVIVFFSVKRC